MNIIKMNSYIVILVSVFFATVLLSFPVLAKSSNKTVGCSASTQHVGVIDQQQCDYDSGLSARTSYQNSFWQSFTAGKTGELTEVDLGFFGNINGYGTLALYSGEGLGGTGLGSARVLITCTSRVVCIVPFSFSAPVVSGQKYTLRFIPGYGMPDPYGVQLGTHNPYKDGTFAYVVATSESLTDYDLVFTTFVN